MDQWGWDGHGEKKQISINYMKSADDILRHTLGMNELRTTLCQCDDLDFSQNICASFRKVTA